MKLDSKALVAIAQGELKATLNGELLLNLAQNNDIDSKTDLAKELNLSRMHLYRLLAGNNVGIVAVKKIINKFPNYREELFFLKLL